MEAGSMEKMSNREMKKTVKIEKQLKKATSRKKQKQFRANQAIQGQSCNTLKEKPLQKHISQTSFKAM